MARQVVDGLKLSLTGKEICDILSDQIRRLKKRSLSDNDRRIADREIVDRKFVMHHIKPSAVYLVPVEEGYAYLQEPWLLRKMLRRKATKRKPLKLKKMA